MRLMSIELRYECVVGVWCSESMASMQKPCFASAYQLYIISSEKPMVFHLGKTSQPLSVKQFFPNSPFAHGEQLWTSGKSDKGG